MYKHCRVLVTGAGSGVGQSIIKALRLSQLPLSIISADITPMNAGLYRTNEAVIIPRVESEGSLEEIVAILLRNKIDVVMVGSEFDLVFFSKNKAVIESQTGILIVAAPLETVNITDDKRSNGVDWCSGKNTVGAWRQEHIPLFPGGGIRPPQTPPFPVGLRPLKYENSLFYAGNLFIKS